jgi:hypothetical protein
MREGRHMGNLHGLWMIAHFFLFLISFFLVRHRTRQESRRYEG